MADDERLPERQVPAEWINVDSSWIQAARYHAESRTFDLRINGKEYHGGRNYSDVSAQEFLDFLASPSKGRWIHDHFPSQRGQGRER